MYEVIIKEYLKRLSLKDINDFANKNNVSLKLVKIKFYITL